LLVVAFFGAWDDFDSSDVTRSLCLGGLLVGLSGLLALYYWMELRVRSSRTRGDAIQ
jgi:hypothetical protein